MNAYMVLRKSVLAISITAFIICCSGSGTASASAAGSAPAGGAMKAVDIESEIAKQISARKPLKDIIKPTAFRGAPIDDVIPAAIKAGVPPSQVVYTAITNGYPARSVVAAALKADVDLNAVVNAAIAAGVDKKTIYEAAVDAGAWPVAVSNAIAASSSQASEFVPGPIPGPLPTQFAAPPPAIFGRGGVDLRPLPEWKEGRPLIGSLTFNPFLSVMETFSDNVFFTPADHKKDSITTVMPGLRMQLPFRNQNAELEYYPTITRYQKYTDENRTDHHADAAIDLRAGDRFRLRLFDAYDQDHELRSSSLTGAVEEFRTNAAAASASYLITKDFRVQIGYEQNNWQFKTSTFRDRDENTLSGGLFYRLFTKSAVFIEYDERKTTYSDTALDLDGTVKTVMAGLTWDFSARSKGTIKGGQTRKEFTSPDRSPLNLKVAVLDVRHDFTVDTTVVLTGQRSLEEPNLPDMSHFFTTGGYAELSQRIVSKLAATIRGAYVEDRYYFLNQPQRIDRTSVVGGGLRVKAAKWLEFAVDHNYHARHSTLPEDEYIERSTMITATASL